MEDCAALITNGGTRCPRIPRNICLARWNADDLKRDNISRSEAHLRDPWRIAVGTAIILPASKNRIKILTPRTFREHLYVFRINYTYQNKLRGRCAAHCESDRLIVDGTWVLDRCFVRLSQVVPDKGARLMDQVSSLPVVKTETKLAEPTISLGKSAGLQHHKIKLENTVRKRWGGARRR